MGIQTHPSAIAHSESNVGLYNTIETWARGGTDRCVPGYETGDAVTSHIDYFPIVDALFAMVSPDLDLRLRNGGGVVAAQGNTPTDESGSSKS